MPNWVYPRCEVTLYDEGDADPVVTTPGYCQSDVLAQTARYGSSTQSNGLNLCRFLDGIGLCCAEQVRLQNLRATHGTASGGTWSEVLPEGAGAVRRYRLVQGDCSANLVWSWSTSYDVPADAARAWSLARTDTPYDHDTTSYPPRVRLVMGIQAGVGQWALEWSREAGGGLLEMQASGAWARVADLPDLTTPEGLDESLVLVRVQRGQILVSVDGGRRYTAYGRPDGSPVSIRGGRWRVEGQGCGVVVGYHQVLFSAAVYTSAPRHTGQIRALPPTVNLSGRYAAPSGSSVVYGDAGTYGSGIARYTVTLTPAALLAVPFTHYLSPEAYTATYQIDPVISTVAASSSLISESQIVAWSVDRPEDLAQSECRITLRRSVASAWSGTYRGRKIRVRLGWYLDDTTTTWWTAFVGYIVSPPVTREGFGELVVEIVAAGVSHRLRRTLWTPDYVPVLSDSGTMGGALDAVLVAAGIPRNSSYRIWTNSGWPLPPGRHEEPFERAREREAYWATMERIAQYGRCVLAESTDGILQTVAPDYYSGTTHDYRCSTTATLAELAMEIREDLDYRDTGTAVYVTGESESGERVWAVSADTYAESAVGSGRFQPWREALVETMDEVSGTVSPGALAARSQVLAHDWYGLSRNVQIVAPMNPGVTRRDRVRVYDATALGIPDGTYHVVRGVTHQGSVDPRTGHRTARSMIRARRQ